MINPNPASTQRSAEVQKAIDRLFEHNEMPPSLYEYITHLEAQATVTETVEDPRDYLIRNVLQPLWPDIKPLDTLMGVCTQVDNVAVEIERSRAQIAALQETVRAYEEACMSARATFSTGNTLGAMTILKDALTAHRAQEPAGETNNA